MGQYIPKGRFAHRHEDHAEINRRVGLLTTREREVMAGVIAGLTNIQMGKMLGISSRTVEVHRANIMDKLGAANTAHLVRMLTLAGF